MRLLPLLLAPAVLLPLLTGPAAAASAGPADGGGFHSVLAYGEGQSVNAADLAQYQASGAAPGRFTDQARLYNQVITQQPGNDADLARFYKDSSFDPTPAGATTESPEAGAVIARDAAHGVARITGATRDEAMYAVGYATAEERLFLMDVLRRTAEGSTAELLGPSAVPADSAALGQFDASPQQLTAEVMRLPQDEGAEGARALADLQQYVAGINAYISAAMTDPRRMPTEYAALGATPRPWTLADTAAEAYLLIAQFTVAGDGEQRQADLLARLRIRLGNARGTRAYDDLRRLEDPAAPVTTTRRFPSDDPGRVQATRNAHLRAGSIRPRNAVTSSRSGAATPASFAALATRGLALPHEASNALLVAASHSADGHALAAMGPQVSYYSPEVLVEYEVHAPGVDVSGMSFPGASPMPLIGHAATFAWTGTTALGDNADTFAELLCNPDGSAPTTASDHYRYRGHCVAFARRQQVLHTPVAPTSPGAPGTYTLTALSSVHGPVFGYAVADGAPVALVRAVAVVGRGIRSLTAFTRLAEGQVHSPQDFVAAMRHFTGNENWFYVSQKHIGWLASGWFPQHAPGSDLELPLVGDGRADWKGFDPATGAFTRHADSFNPVSVDPAAGYLASWNNKAAPGWHASPGTWSFGRVQRVQLLADPVRTAIAHGQTLTLAQLVGISGNAATQDLRAVTVGPALLDVLGAPADPRLAPLVADLRTWLASGAHRRDSTGSGSEDDSAAVLAFDAWWKQVVHAVYDPPLGRDVVVQIERDEDLVLDGRAVDTGFFDGWQSQLAAALGAALGRRESDAPSVLRCASGTAAGCHALVTAALERAYTQLTGAYGSDPGSWRKPVLCHSDPTPTCDENRPLTAGAVATPSQPFENRGTFHQAVDIATSLDGS